VKSVTKFVRGGYGSNHKKDDKGTVCVKIYLVKGSTPVKGNKSRSVTIKDVTVSEVMAAIEQALFGD
jgi:hypothetical protein